MKNSREICGGRTEKIILKISTGWSTNEATLPSDTTHGKKWKPNERMPTGNSAQLEHAPVMYAKNEKDISSRRS